jgi:large subunit ribosomal protein L27
MAHKKGGGAGKNGRNSPGQRLGIKAFGSETVTIGSIIVRQRGTKFLPGLNVRRAKDDTLFAMADGQVQYEWTSGDKKRVKVVPVTKQ